MRRKPGTEKVLVGTRQIRLIANMSNELIGGIAHSSSLVVYKAEVKDAAGLIHSQGGAVVTEVVYIMSLKGLGFDPQYPLSTVNKTPNSPTCSVVKWVENHWNHLDRSHLLNDLVVNSYIYCKLYESLPLTGWWPHDLFPYFSFPYCIIISSEL